MKPRTRMHTAEHILSAVMRIDYGAPRNLELHLGDKKTKCDYEPSRSVNPEDIAAISDKVNKEIQKNHPVSHFVIPRTEAVEYDLWKAPEDAREIRIVKIGDLDAQPCSGEHVARTQEIGSFRITSHEWRENGRLRIRFKVGNVQNQLQK